MSGLVGWRFWFEGESGLTEESGDESGLPLDAVRLMPHRGGELVYSAGGEVPDGVLVTDQAPSTGLSSGA